MEYPFKLFHASCVLLAPRLCDTYGAFKSCRIHRIYELNALESHHKVVITSGKLKIVFKPRVGGTSVKKRVGCNGCSQKLNICSVSKVVEIKKIIFLGGGLMYNKTI